MPFGISETALALGIGSAGAGILGSIFGSRPKETKSSSTSTVTTPDSLQPLQGGITSDLMRRLLDPSAGIAPLRAGARNAVNDTFSGVDQGLRDRLLSGGAGGSSGKFGLATAKSSLARGSALSALEPQFAGLQLSQGNNNLSLAQQFLRAGQGTSTSGTNVQPGNMTGNALGSAGGSLGNLSTLFSLSQLLGPGGGGGGYAAGYGF